MRHWSKFNTFITRNEADFVIAQIPTNNQNKHFEKSMHYF